MPSDIHARLLALAADAREQARRLRETAETEAQRLETMAALWESQAGEAQERLTSAHEPSTLADVNASPSTSALKSRAALTDDARKHPFVAQVLIARNKDVGEIARWLSTELKRQISRSTVQAWYKDPSDAAFRRIPDDAERAIRKRFALPRSSWPKVQPPRRA